MKYPTRLRGVSSLDPMGPVEVGWADLVFVAEGRSRHLLQKVLPNNRYFLCCDKFVLLVICDSS